MHLLDGFGATWQNLFDIINACVLYTKRVPPHLTEHVLDILLLLLPFDAHFFYVLAL